MAKVKEPRIAWALTGSGHYLKECLDIVRTLPNVDLFLTKAAAEVLKMYGYDLKRLKEDLRIFRDTTASAVPVTFLYEGNYHSVVIAPATSNTVAKCVAGISDTLATNIYAQAGKCLIPSIVFACDTAPELISEAPGGDVWVYPRPIDLENVGKLGKFDHTTVVISIDELQIALKKRVERGRIA
jgi:flavoprotein